MIYDSFKSIKCILKELFESIRASSYKPHSVFAHTNNEANQSPKQNFLLSNIRWMCVNKWYFLSELFWSTGIGFVPLFTDTNNETKESRNETIKYVARLSKLFVFNRTSSYRFVSLLTDTTRQTNHETKLICWMMHDRCVNKCYFLSELFRSTGTGFVPLFTDTYNDTNETLCRVIVGTIRVVTGTRSYRPDSFLSLHWYNETTNSKRKTVLYDTDGFALTNVISCPSYLHLLGWVRTEMIRFSSLTLTMR